MDRTYTMRHTFFSCYESIHSAEREEVRGKLWPQIQASFVGSVTNMGIGAVIGFSGITFPALIHPKHDDLTLTQMEIELFGSLCYLGSLFGCIFSGICMVWYGQRISLFIAMPMAFIGWMLLGIGESIWMIQLARFLLGFYVGVGYTAAGNYVAEISHHSIRGQLSSLVNISRQLGFLFIYGIGSLNITWRQLAFLSGGVTIVGPFLGLFFLPDSPRWLASVKRFDEAKQSLVTLRGSNYAVDQELEMIFAQVLVKEKSGTVLHQLRELRSPTIMKRFLFLNVIFILYSLSGNCPIVSYTATIFKDANNYLNKYKSTTLIGMIRILGSVAFLLVGDKFSRRAFTVTASIFMIISTFLLGVYFHLKQSYDISNLRWIPLLSLSTHQFFSLFNPINFFPGELLPTSVRSVGSSIIWSLSFIAAFLAVFFFPAIKEKFGMSANFWLYCLGSIGFYIAVTLYLPESGGISLEIVNNELGNMKTVTDSDERDLKTDNSALMTDKHV